MPVRRFFRHDHVKIQNCLRNYISHLAWELLGITWEDLALKWATLFFGFSVLKMCLSDRQTLSPHTFPTFPTSEFKYGHFMQRCERRRDLNFSLKLTFFRFFTWPSSVAIRNRCNTFAFRCSRTTYHTNFKLTPNLNMLPLRPEPG